MAADFMMGSPTALADPTLESEVRDYTYRAVQIKAGYVAFSKQQKATNLLHSYAFYINWKYRRF